MSDKGLPDRLSNACQHCAYEITDHDLDQPGQAWFPLNDDDILDADVVKFEGEIRADALACRHGDWMERLLEGGQDRLTPYCPWRDHLNHVQPTHLRALLQMGNAPAPLLKHSLLDGVNETLLSIVLEHYYMAGDECRDMALALIDRGCLEKMRERAELRI